MILTEAESTSAQRRGAKGRQARSQFTHASTTKNLSREKPAPSFKKGVTLFLYLVDTIVKSISVIDIQEERCFYSCSSTESEHRLCVLFG